jgi:hypothetical protein
LYLRIGAASFRISRYLGGQAPAGGPSRRAGACRGGKWRDSPENRTFCDPCHSAGHVAAAIYARAPRCWHAPHQTETTTMSYAQPYTTLGEKIITVIGFLLLSTVVAVMVAAYLVGIA